MNRTTIKLNGKSVDILFGCWAIGQILKSGIDLTNLGADIYEHLPEIAYYGACNASGRSLDSYNIDEFHELSPGVLMAVLPVFTQSMTQDVPKKEAVKAEIKPKTTKK